MTRTEESRLRALEDREAIRELQATYCFLVDDRRFDELADRHFAKDARCDFRLLGSGVDPLVAEGRDEIRAFFESAVGVGGEPTMPHQPSGGRTTVMRWSLAPAVRARDAASVAA